MPGNDEGEPPEFDTLLAPDNISSHHLVQTFYMILQEFNNIESFQFNAKFIEEFMSDLYFVLYCVEPISKNSKYKINNPADTGYVKLYLFNYGQFQSFNFQHTLNFKFILKDIFLKNYLL